MLKFLLVVALVAVAIYLVVRLAQRGTSPRAARGPATPRPRAIAPDDDEDFLRDLDRRAVHDEDDEPETGR